MKPIVTINKDSERVYLYKQVYDEIKNGIVSGNYKPGDKLPSLRGLSNQLGISVTSISGAYDQLYIEGYIYSVPGSGYFVKDVLADNSGILPVTSDDKKDMPHATKKLYDTNTFDFNRWKKCASKVFTEQYTSLLHESDVQGEYALRKQISNYIYRSRGVKAEPERIIIGAGTQQITGHITRILKKIGISLITIEEPGYLPVQSILNDAGFTLIHAPVSEEGINPVNLPVNLPSAVYVSPSNQFPTGRVMPISKRYQLLKWADENKSYIVEDDYDSELRYFGKPVPSLKSIDTNDRVIYLSSFSSTLFPAIKLSYMVLPKSLMDIFMQMKKYYTQTCSKSEQLTLALFMENGYYYQGIKKLRNLYSEKLEKTTRALKDNFGSMIEITSAVSGISITLKIKSDKPVQTLAKLAEETGLDILPVSSLSDQQSQAMIFYFSNIPLRSIDCVISQLKIKWTTKE